MTWPRDVSPEADLQLALQLADLADLITLRYFGRLDLRVDSKPDLSPVSEADREVEQALRQRLADMRPGDAVLGEELGAAGSGGRRWILDPIDGTRRFIRGVPTYATLIALEEQNTPTVGVVSAPALGHRWWAARGLGAYRDDAQMAVSGIARLEDAHVGHGSLEGWIRSGLLNRLARIAGRCWSTAGHGDFWIHLMVAEGSAEAALEPEASLWDLAALKVIVEEAGGTLTDFTGAHTAAGGNAVTSNDHLHGELLHLLTSRP